MVITKQIYGKTSILCKETRKKNLSSVRSLSEKKSKNRRETNKNLFKIKFMFISVSFCFLALNSNRWFLFHFASSFVSFFHNNKKLMSTWMRILLRYRFHSFFLLTFNVFTSYVASSLLLQCSTRRGLQPIKDSKTTNRRHYHSLLLYFEREIP